MWKSGTRTALSLSLACALLGACDLVSFEELEVDTKPGIDNEVLPLGTELEVGFSIPPDHRSAEAAVRLVSEGEMRSGDFRWEGDRLFLRPVPELEAGKRNVLAVEGEIRSRDGRRFTVHRSLAFFSGNDGTCLALSGYSPSDAAVVDVGQSLAFSFSSPVDAESFKKSFTLSPSTEYDLSFAADAMGAVVSPRTAWTNATFYSWELKASLKGVAGNAMSGARKGGFLVQADAVPPRLLGIVPANSDGSSFLPLDGLPLSSLRNGDALYLRFSEDVDMGTLKGALRIEPNLRWHVLRDHAGAFAFVFDDAFAPETEYRLVVGTEVADLAGNKMTEAYSERFTPSLPWQRVLKVVIADGVGNKETSVFNTSSSLAVSLPDVEKKLVFTIEFERPIEAGFRAQSQQAVQCLKFFPVGDAFDPTLESAIWTSPTTLSLVYVGFKDSGAAASYHYRLRIAGGTGGVLNAEGARLKEDQWLIFHDE